MSALDASCQGPFGKGYAPDQEGSEKLHSGPAERNTPPIIEVLKTNMVGWPPLLVLLLSTFLST